jgi:hypothetical protein
MIPPSEREVKVELIWKSRTFGTAGIIFLLVSLQSSLEIQYPHPSFLRTGI